MSAEAVAAGRTWASGRGWLGWPASWLIAGLTAVGLGVLASAFGPVAARHPAATATAVTLFALHGAVFVAVIRTVDWLEREPWPLLTAAAVWGGVVASSNALRANMALESILVKVSPLAFVRDWAAAIEGPTNEELLKTLGIVAIVLLARPYVNSILDGVIYGAFVGLGFQEVENVIYALNAVGQAGSDTLTPVWQTFFVRGLAAGLWSHTVYSAIAGAGVAYAVLRTNRSWAWRLAGALAALLVAWAGHFLWNSPLLGTLPLIVAMLAKGVLILGAFLLLLRLARRGEFEALSTRLAAPRDPALATPGEIAALRLHRTRRLARWNAWTAAGAPAARAVKRLQRAQADLAVALRDGGPDDVAGRLSDVRVARDRLWRLGITEADGTRRSTAMGWVSLVLALGALVIPLFVVAPLVLFLLGVQRARRRRVHADPRLRTALWISVVFSAVWLVDVLAQVAQIR